MGKTLYFYDLETSGFNPKEARIMQYAGQRTGLDLKPIGQPNNYLIRLTNDILPDPGAVLLTGITPQRTINDGYSEAEFLKIFHKEIVTPDTIFVGFNSVRFDDEFMRYLHYRNFYDAYEWQWRDGRSKWDLLDVARMMRALRPDGINWPIQDGKSTNKLELITKLNNISHSDAHDALADVSALTELAVLINKHQPKLFSFLLDIMTSKDNIDKFISHNDKFVYTSGKYPSEFEKTTVVAKLADHPKRQGVLVFDLRFDPTPLANLSVDDLVEAWQPKDKDSDRLPIKTLQFNRCPAIAPINVLDEYSQKRLKLTIEEINANYIKLQDIKEKFSKKLLQTLAVLDNIQETKYAAQSLSVDARLYDGFFSSQDKIAMTKVRASTPQELLSLQVKFSDNRLNQLLPLYKARNYPNTLSVEEVKFWDKYRANYLLKGGENSRLSKYFSQLQELSNISKQTKTARYLIEELNLYGLSVLPNDTE